MKTLYDLIRLTAVLTQMFLHVAAKNVILAGVKAVVLHDTSDVQLQDLSAQFYLTEASVGTNRAAACKDKLQELNTAVAVSASSAELNEQFIGQFQVRVTLFLIQWTNTLNISIVVEGCA